MADSFKDDVLIIDKPRADIVDLAPEIIKNNKTWVDMLEVFSQVLNANVDGPIEQLEQIRYIYQDTDKQILKHTARLLGFDLSQDVLSLSAETITKIVTQLSHYPDYNGPDLFIKFEELILNARIEIKALFTKDYLNFYEVPGGTLITDGGSWFKTTHIELTVGLKNLQDLVLMGDQTLFGRIKALFYNFAPITLVVKYFYFLIVFEDADFLGGTAFGLGATMANDEHFIIVK